MSALLPHAVSRCYGHDLGRGDCGQRDTCSRFVTMRTDPPVTLTYSMHLCDTPEHERRIPLEAGRGLPVEV